MKAKRILVVHNSYQIRGGEDIVFENEVRMLKNAGHEVETYERSNREISEAGMWKKTKIALGSFFSINTYRDINKIITDKQIDILHVHNTFFLISSAVYFSAFKNKIPVVQTLHNFRLICPNGFLLRDEKICEECIEKGLRCALVHRCYRGNFFDSFLMVANLWLYRKLGILRRIHFICLTEFNKEKLKSSKAFKKLGLSETQLFVKNNFVANVEIMDKLNDIREPYFLFCGRLSQEKGIITLLRAWSMCKDDFFKEGDSEKIRLIVLGDGPLMQECKEIATQIGDGSIELKGFMSKEIVNSYMQHAIATIVPSEWFEGAPLVVIEAFANACPVIGSDIGNVKNSIKNGYNGYCFETGNPRSLAKTMTCFLKLNREELRRGALESFRNHYSEEKNLRILEEIFAKVCGETDNL